MADFRIGSTVPAEGKIKLGSSNVVKIYKGSTLLWPNLPTNSAAIPCSGRIWTIVNSTETSGTVSGSAVTIPIVTNANDASTKSLNQQYAAAYYNFDSNNAHMGLYYNKWAAEVVNVPSGFRKPTTSDWNSLFRTACISNASNALNPDRYNLHAVITSNSGWDTSTSSPHPSGNVNFTLSDTTEIGDSGFNAKGYNYGSIFGNQTNFKWANENKSRWWQFQNDTNVHVNSNNQLESQSLAVNFSNNSADRYLRATKIVVPNVTNMNQQRHLWLTIRFCKDN